jgi:hypothetical protein
MLFSPLITSLVVVAMTQMAAASDAIPRGNKDCITFGDIQTTYTGLLAVTEKYKIPFPEDFPSLTAIRNNDVNSCVRCCLGLSC